MLKVGDKVKTNNPKVKTILNKKGTNKFQIQYFIEDKKKAYLTSIEDRKGWAIEEVANLELLIQ